MLFNTKRGLSFELFNLNKRLWLVKVCFTMFWVCNYRRSCAKLTVEYSINAVMPKKVKIYVCAKKCLNFYSKLGNRNSSYWGRKVIKIYFQQSSRQNCMALIRNLNKTEHIQNSWLTNLLITVLFFVFEGFLEANRTMHVSLPVIAFICLETKKKFLTS